MDLDGLIGGRERGLGGELLGEGGLAGAAPPLVLEPAGLQVEQAGDFVILRHPGDLFLDELMVGDRRPEGLARAGIFYAGLERGPDETGSAGGHRVTAVVEGGHGDLEALALLADPVLERDVHVLE